MFIRNFGGPEIALIVLAIVVLFGVGKLATTLPNLGRGLGQAIKEFRTSTKSKDEAVTSGVSPSAPNSDADTQSAPAIVKEDESRQAS